MKKPKIKGGKGRGNSAVLENKDGNGSEASDDEDEDDAEGSVTGTVSGSSEDEDEEDSEDGGQEAPKKVSVKGRRKAANLVQITMLRSIPCPRIGKHDLLSITGVTHLNQSESYYVPEDAAEVLLDRKAAILNGQ